MRVKLLRDARIKHNAGETVDVSPAEAAFLLSVESAEQLPAEPDPEQEEQEDAQPQKRKRQTKKKQ